MRRLLDWFLERTALVHELRFAAMLADETIESVASEYNRSQAKIASLTRDVEAYRKERDEWKEEAEVLQAAIASAAERANAYEVARQEDTPPF